MSSIRKRQDTTALILAGGAGRRMNGHDKGLLMWKEKRLVQHVAERIAPQVRSLIISCNRNIEQYLDVSPAVIEDQLADFQGPLAGIAAAIPHIHSRYLAVVPCDTPLLPMNLVDRLVSTLEEDKELSHSMSYARDETHKHYLCAVIRVASLDSLVAYLDSGQRTVRHWYRDNAAIAVNFPGEHAAFLNFNEPDSLKGS